MTLLTWQKPPTLTECKKARAEFAERWRERWGEGMDAWILEMHRRGVPHLHLFHCNESNFGIACLAAEKETVERTNSKGETNKTELVVGEVEDWVATAWMECIRASELSPADYLKTQKFNRGGIIEVFRNPAGAARYVAKEAGGGEGSKRYQKELPERYSEGLGRWWYLARRWKPVVEFRGRVSVDSLRKDLGWGHPLSRVWDASTIAVAIIEAHRPMLDATIDMQLGTG